MTMRITGLSSGLDTDSMIEALVSDYSSQVDKYTNLQTKLGWEQDIWSDLNDKIYSLYTSISNLRYSAAYALQKVTCSDTTKATVSSSGSAVVGTQTLNVLQTAQSGYLTGGKLTSSSGSAITSDTKLSDLGVTSTGSIYVTTKDDDGKDVTTEIQLKSDSTISDVVSALKNAGLTASFDEDQGRFYISSKTSGTDGDFTITAKTTSGNAVLSALGLSSDAKLTGSTIQLDSSVTTVALGTTVGNITNSTEGTSFNFTYTNADGSSDTGTINVTMYSTIQDILDQFNEQGVTATFDSNSKTISFAGLSDISFSAVEGTTQTLTEEEMYGLSGDASDYTKVYNDDGSYSYYSLKDLSEENGYYTSGDGTCYNINVAYTAEAWAEKTDGLSDEEIEDLKASLGNDLVETQDSDGNTIYYFLGDAVDESDIYDDGNGNVSLITGTYTNQYTIGANAGDYQAVTDDEGNITGYTRTVDSDGSVSTTLLANLGLVTAETDDNGDVTLTSALKTDTSGSAVKIDGADAMIVLNGVVYTSSSNDFQINGLTISVTGVTDADYSGYVDPETGEIDASKLQKESSNTISITTSTDTQGLYDLVKDFLTQYNSIINEITKYYNADSASGYDVLSDDDKDSMTDTEIEKWETKIKDSLLRRDTSLGAVMNAMENAMTGAITINGVKYTLSSFGIQTLGYLNAPENEQNAYHIDGDEDDENTSSNTDKLMAALISDPDTVVEFFKQLTTNLYKALDDQMQSTSMSSRYKVYNDKEMATQYANYTTTIANWESKLSTKEDYWYSKFAAMETALSKLDSSSSALSSLLGS
ncbi:MAG: flagellar filament capping protein FliD [Clostridiales bacterium]|nr:flagellar filament capping protein FliD [Clostridiales bacterium]